MGDLTSSGAAKVPTCSGGQEARQRIRELLETYAAKHGVYDLQSNPDLWLRIFAAVFGRPPDSLEDKAWDELLFRQGHGALDIAAAVYEEFKTKKGS